MKKLLTSAAAVLVLIFAFAPMSFAADAEQALDKCKSEAESDEVADSDIQIYVTNCMKDMGVAATDIKALVDEEFSTDEKETAKSSTEE